jgi:4-amino-4-deoxy-L-arabinose transferase-like glycosyltransferase
MEFPIIPYAVALMYRVAGVHEWLTLLIPMASGLGLVIVIYRFARLVFDPAVGFAAGLFAAISPTLVGLSTGLWPDPPMTFCGALGLWGLAVWVKRDSRPWLVFGALGIAAAILLKITALYIGIPVLFLCIVKYGSAWWRKADVWLLGLLALAPPTLWYWHAFSLYREYHNTFGILTGGYLKFATLDLLLRPGFYTTNLFRIVMYHVTPAASAAVLYGLWIRQRTSIGYVFHVWLGALVILFIVSARGVLIGHYQYLMPIVAPAAALAGAGTLALYRKLASRASQPAPGRSNRLALAFGIVFALNAVGASALFYVQGLRVITAFWEEDKRTGLAVGASTIPGSLIIVADTQMDDVTPERSMTPPNVFYFSDHRGWYESLAWVSPAMIEELRSQGGRYFVVTGNALTEFSASYAPIESFLSEHYRAILNTSDGRVYDLSAGAGAANELPTP